MFIAILQNIINVIFSLLLVLVFKMNITGVAYGALIAQWSGLCIAMFFVFRQVKHIKGNTQAHTL